MTRTSERRKWRRRRNRRRRRKRSKKRRRRRRKRRRTGNNCSALTAGRLHIAPFPGRGLRRPPSALRCT
eukprot:9101464-Pyramimonas_sp.AAC.1